jgi:hypothetical protein
VVADVKAVFPGAEIADLRTIRAQAGENDIDRVARFATKGNGQ